MVLPDWLLPPLTPHSSVHFSPYFPFVLLCPTLLTSVSSCPFLFIFPSVTFSFHPSLSLRLYHTFLLCSCLSPFPVSFFRGFFLTSTSYFIHILLVSFASSFLLPVFPSIDYIVLFSPFPFPLFHNIFSFSGSPSFCSHRPLSLLPS